MATMHIYSGRYTNTSDILIHMGRKTGYCIRK